MIDNKKAAEHAEAQHVLRLLNPGMVQQVVAAPAPDKKKEVMTLKEFVDTHYMEKMRTTGNKKGKNKPATLNAKESHLRVVALHFHELLGHSRQILQMDVGIATKLI